MKVTKQQAIALQADLDTRGYRKPGGEPHTDLSDIIGMSGVVGMIGVVTVCFGIATVAVFSLIGG